MQPHPRWYKLDLLQSPLFAPLHAVIAQLDDNNFPCLSDLNRLLARHPSHIQVGTGNALQFVAQHYGKLPFAAQYEPRCYLQGEVPTRRNNWHDLLNALVWLTFPRAKATINVRHYQALTIPTTPASAIATSQRGTVRDAITLLDESGIIIAYAENALAEHLRDFQWKELFWHKRQQVRTQMGFYLFGHGLYEKALHPYVGMTGHALLLPVAQAFFAWPQTARLSYLDQRVADYLSESAYCQHPHELSPVPVLGIPGWTIDNEDSRYYDNTAYFRAGRKARTECVL